MKINQTSEHTWLDLAVKKIVNTPANHKTVVEVELNTDTKRRFLAIAKNIRAKYCLSVPESKAAALVYLIEASLTIPELVTSSTGATASAGKN